MKRYVMSNDIETAQYQDELVIAVGEPDELYPEAKIVDLTLVAKDGKITLTEKPIMPPYPQQNIMMAQKFLPYLSI